MDNIPNGSSFQRDSTMTYALFSTVEYPVSLSEGDLKKKELVTMVKSDASVSATNGVLSAIAKTNAFPCE